MAEYRITKLQLINISFPSILSTEQPDSRYIITTAAIISGIISVIAIFGNLFNIIFIWRTPALHNLNNLIILNLSVIDFLNGSIVLPMIIVFITTTKQPYPVCQFQGFMLFWLYTASLTTSSAIAFDRLYAITYPLRYHPNTTVKKLIIIFTYIWFIPTVIATLPLLGLQQFGLGKYLNLDLCFISFLSYDDNYIVCWIFTIIIAVVITSILSIYAVIFFIAYRKTTQGLARGGNLKRSIRTTALIVGTNLLCWLPFLIFNYDIYVDAVNPPVLTNIFSPSGYAVTVVILFFSNAAINPLIYIFTNSYTRKGLLHLFHNNRVHDYP